MTPGGGERAGKLLNDQANTIVQLRARIIALENAGDSLNVALIEAELKIAAVKALCHGVAAIDSRLIARALDTPGGPR